jgi:carboxymethylenebutenolidase
MSMRIEVFYALASPWAYLGQRKFLELAARHGATVVPYLVDYDHMFHAAGTIPLPQRPAARKAYRQVELKRWSAFRGVTLNPRPRFYNGEVSEPDEAEAARMVIAAEAAGLDSLALSYAIQRAVWAEERFPFERAELLAIAATLGMDGAALLAAAATPAVQARYEDNTTHAIARGVFGMPTYIVEDGDIFWGQDRLELLEWCLAQGMTKS